MDVVMMVVVSISIACWIIAVAAALSITVYAALYGFALTVVATVQRLLPRQKRVSIAMLRPTGRKVTDARSRRVRRAESRDRVRLEAAHPRRIK